MANETRNAVSGAKPLKRNDAGELLEEPGVVPQKRKDVPRVSSAKPAQQLGFSKDARTKIFQMVDEIEKGCGVWRVDTENPEALIVMLKRVENAVKEIKKNL